jgi:methylated-DNA-protein-cysteine methyltransferase-like protein
MSDDRRSRLYEEIYALVRQVPPGRVVSYGQIAACLDRCTPRQVGYAMAALPTSSGVPWQRVINSRGEVSARRRGAGHHRQRQLLEQEGVRFDDRGRVDLKRYGWLTGEM